MIEVAYSVRTTGSAWTVLASGPVILTDVGASNISGIDCMISVRLRKAAGNALIIPADLLPGSAGESDTNPRIGMLPLETGDVLEVQSSQSVDWAAQGTQIASTRPYNKIGGISGGAWTTITAEVGPVNSLLFANTSMGTALVSAQVIGGVQPVTLFTAQEIEEGGSMRKLDPATLAAGRTLQVRATGGVDVIATGVRA